MRNLMIVGLASACLMAAACSKTETAAAPAAKRAEPSAEVKAEKARLDAAAVIPAELVATGVSIKDATVKAVNGELEVTGMLTNASAKAIDGVNLMITFQDAHGTALGGHSTQQFFQPALGVGKSQAIVLRAPAIGGTVNSASAASIEVVNLVKAGQSPDGWKPLDPNHLPEPKVVKTDKAVVIPVEGTLAVPAAPAQDKKG